MEVGNDCNDLVSSFGFTSMIILLFYFPDLHVVNVDVDVVAVVSRCCFLLTSPAEQISTGA